MKVECPDCQKVYNIPDEKLPKGKKFSFPCPSCKGKIIIDNRPDAAPQSDAAPQGDAAPPKAEAGAPEPSAGGGGNGDSPESDKLKAKILRTLKDLPPMPNVLIKAREIMNDNKSGFQELAVVLETDQAIATKVLRMANSPYYGMSGKVSSIQHASVVLGAKVLGELVTMAGSSSLIGNALEGYGLEAGGLWMHSMAVAFGSRIIANKKAPEISNDAFSAGLIHDAGKLILNSHVLDRQADFEMAMSTGEETFLNAEKEILGFDHAEIASEACKKWNIPEALAIGIRYHHDPSETDDNKLAHVLHTADSLALMSGIGTGFDGMLYSMDEHSLDVLNLEADELTDFMEEIADYVGKMEQEME